MEKLRFPIIIEQDEDKNYIIGCPVFKSRHSHGRTFNEALESIIEAIELCFEESK